jgi:acetylornithine/succinyldiaminopimelate/putrescine aminotransferase
VGLEGVESVRGSGLLLGVQLSEGISSATVVAEALGRGLIINAVTPTAIRLAPPLTVLEAELDEALAIMSAAITAASGEVA